jgi:putative hydrolase
VDPAEALERIAFVMERNLAPSYKVQAFRNAAEQVRRHSLDELHELAQQKRLESLSGVGKSSAQVIQQALDGKVPDRLVAVEAEPDPYEVGDYDSPLLRALRGDCHMHSDWSDGGSPIETMARTARDIGHEYALLTDHSPRLKVANGLTAERLLAQFEEVERVNGVMRAEEESGAPPFRLLQGIEVDILDDGALDQTDELLSRLDVVVASVHSDLRADSETMTKRMLAAISGTRMNILGHCTGRKVMGRNRPPSTFDARAVFEACVEHDVAVEINARPERKDPPMELLRLASDIGCNFSIDTDSHAPGQLSWQVIGVERADTCGITANRVKNTLPADDLVAWARRRAG